MPPTREFEHAKFNLFHAIVEQAPDAIIFADRDGAIRVWNHDTGQTKHANQVLTTRSVHKSGAKLYVDLSFGLVKDQTGAVTGALAVGRDCTTRYLSGTPSRDDRVSEA